jgi:uncharacterized protein (DUF1800 family)
MMSRKSRLFPRILNLGFVFLLSTCVIFAGVKDDGDDPNPDSPTPVLLSEPGSTRALVAPPSFLLQQERRRPMPRKMRKEIIDEVLDEDLSDSENDDSISLETLSSRAFEPGENVLLFVTNVALLENEDAGAFRIDAQDAQGRKYRFPVLNIQPLKNQPWIYALTIQIKDELDFWETLSTDGDVLVGVSWRGLMSNRARLGIGKMGGAIQDDEESTPTPVQNFLEPLVLNTNATEKLSTSGYPYSGDRIRFIEQASFGASPELDNRIRRLGLRVWLNQQFSAPYPTIPYPDIPLMPTNATTDCQNNIPANCIRDHYTMYPVQNWFYKEAFYGDAQLRHRVAWALSQLWVISGVETDQSSHMLAYYKILAQHSFGNYRDLMRDMTLNPGMGNFLDMARSTRNSPNENYAREILQLFSIGLFMLNQDGTLQRDAQGNPIPTYDQTTVNNFTKVFTGFSFCNVQANCPSFVIGTVNYKDPMILNQNNHDVTAKTLLNYPGAPNVNIAANTNGNTELNQALDNIFNHPNVGPFVSRYLIQHLVTSDPTPAYVGRVAAVFNNNGSGVRGDLKEVVKAILLDPEARGNTKTDPNYGKLREPVQLATNLLRTFGVTAANGGGQSDGYINPQVTTLGQNAFNAQSVFNYYSPTYIIPGTSLNGPEFAILNTGTSIARANFANTMVFNRINTSANAPLGTSLNLADMQALAAADATGNQLLDALNQKMLHGTMSSQMRGTIMTAVQAIPSSSPLDRARQAVYLIATSSQYQVQR